MAKYVINQGYDNEQSVEDAEDFDHSDGYFYFADSAGGTVYAISESHVRDIKRVDDSK